MFNLKSPSAAVPANATKWTHLRPPAKVTPAADAPGAPSGVSIAPGATFHLGRPRRGAADPLALPSGQIAALLILRGKGALLNALRNSIAVENDAPTAEDYFALIVNGLAVLPPSMPVLTLTGGCAADAVAQALGQHAGPARFLLARAARRRG